MDKLTLRLFKAIKIESTKQRALPAEIMQESIKRGFVFSSEVAGSYTDKELLALLPVIEKEVGLTAKQMNQSFHKSWAKIKSSDIETLVIEQLLHYITTYGYESLGIYSNETVYIPAEKLEIPDIKTGAIKLTVIHGYTIDQLKEKLLSISGSGIALKEDTVKAIADLAIYSKVTKGEIEGVKNKELKIILYDHLGIIPEAPVEFLRYVVYKSTNTTLLIKNMYLKNLIHDGKDNFAISRLFDEYAKLYGLERLAEVFYRFKPLFLSFKTNSSLNRTINRIRKLAVKYHKPLEADYLSNVASKLKEGELDLDILRSELTKVDIFRKLRLAYALNYRLNDTRSILYKIRNGKGYATALPSSMNRDRSALDIVMGSIVDGLNLKGKKIYLPDNVEYMLPATEKQFTGNVPTGSYVVLPGNMTAGVYWENVKGHRIDLDLSLISTDGKIGWDRSYRTDRGDILFSGDMTDAAHGAAEHFYIERQKAKTYLMFVNYFNHDDEIEVPFKIIVAQKRGKLKANHMVDPNDLIATVSTIIKQKQKILGLISVNSTESRFYFTEFEIGKSITSGNSPFAEHARQYLVDFYKNGIYLRDVFNKAGAMFVSDRTEADIDLSLETLEKDTIIKLLL